MKPSEKVKAYPRRFELILKGLLFERMNVQVNAVFEEMNVQVNAVFEKEKGE